MQRGGKSALVTTKWLKNLLGSSYSRHRILDASWHLPNTGRIAGEEFKEQHIPGALFFDIDDCADKSSDLSHMVPSPEVFENYVGSLGINNDTHVIVYDNNPQFAIFSAQRVWWTFRIFGHEKISVLEGGLPKWLSEGGPVTSDTITVQKEQFKAKFYPNHVKSFSDIENNIKSSEYLLVDARPAGRFKGTAPEPRPDIKPGKIPKSINIPFMDTLNLEDRTMKSVPELKKMFENTGVDLSKPVIGTCGSGISACLVALAAFECGKDDIAIYDGSWTEWYLKAPSELKENVPTD